MTVKVTTKITIGKAIKSELQSRRIKQVVANQVIEDIKNSVSKGISPVRGNRRFPRYKDPSKYPRDLKPQRPVNLELSGDMLNALKFKALSGTSLSVGIMDREQAKKANAHQKGDGVPQRKFLPTESGDQFTVTITRKLRDLYARILSDIIKRAR